MKDDESFKTLRKGLAKQKNDNDLRGMMLELLKEDQKEVKGKGKGKGKEKTKEKETAPKKPKATKTRLLSLCDSIKDVPKKGLDLEKLYRKIDDDYVKNSGKSNIKQTKHLFNVVLPVLKEFNIITIKGTNVKVN